jgi:hypothetical protein
MKKLFAVLTAILMLLIPAAFSDSATMSVTVGNSGPSVQDVQVNYANDPTVNPNAGTTVSVTIYAEADDSNGWDDIDSISCNVSGPGAVQDSPVSLSLVQVDGNTANGTGSFNMDFYDAAGQYVVVCTADDGTSTNDGEETFQYAEATALALDANSGTLTYPGATAGGSAVTITGDTNMGTASAPTIRNTGNVVIDSDMSGTDLTGPGTIVVGSQGYRFGGVGGFTALTTSATTAQVDLGAGASSTEQLDFQLTVPAGKPAGTYTGSVTVDAKKSV